MCEYDSELSRPEGSERRLVTSRRAVLTGAMALAGSAAVAVGTAGASHAEGSTPSVTRVDDGRAANPAPLILVNATLLDPATGDVTPDAIIVFLDRKVAFIGASGSMRQAQRMGGRSPRVVDVAGRFVLPGLLDAHVHVSSLENAQRALMGGATTLRSASTPFFQDVGVKALSAYQPASTPDLVPAGLFVTPYLGDSILADPRLALLSTRPDGVRDVKDLAYLTKVNLDRGAGVIKTRATERAGLPEQDPREQVYFYNQIAAIVATARRRHTPVMCHSHGKEGCYDAVRAGITSLEHGTYVDERTMDLMKKRGTFFTPTFSAVVDLAEPGGEYTDPRLVERGREMLKVLRAAVAEANRRGVRIVAGTDTSYTAATKSTIGGEVAYIASSGVSKLDAIRAATTYNAKLLGLPRKGRLVRGNDADAVVLDGDPLSDITALQRVRMVVSGGAIAKDELSG